jgi:hypothetical protein
VSSTFRWIIVKSEAGSEDIPAGLRDIKLHAYGTFDGWFAAELSRSRKGAVGSTKTRRPRALEWSFPAFEEMVRTASQGGPGLGITCVTSDFIYLIAIASDLEPAIAVTNPELAADYEDGAAAVARCLAEYGEAESRVAAAQRLADWSHHARSRASASDVESALFDKYVFAEEAAGRLLSAFGLPAPPEAHPRFKQALYVRDHGSDSGPWGVTENSILPFVTGHGIDFHGVWSAHGGEPIARFPRTPEGEQEATFARLALLLPPNSKYQRAIVVFDRRLTSAGIAISYPLYLRYVVGAGPDFFGVWRRRRGGPPIATFTRTWPGLLEAQYRAVECSLPMIRFVPSWRRHKRRTHSS